MEIHLPRPDAAADDARHSNLNLLLELIALVLFLPGLLLLLVAVLMAASMYASVAMQSSAGADPMGDFTQRTGLLAVLVMAGALLLAGPMLRFFAGQR